jgi:hypothetical protein
MVTDFFTDWIFDDVDDMSARQAARWLLLIATFAVAAAFATAGC